MTYYIISMVLFALCLLTAIITAVSRFKVLWNSKEKVIVILLIATIILESAANFMLWKYWKSPARITDSLSFISILLIIWWFYLYLNNKWLIILSILIVIAAFILDLIYNNEIKTQLPLNSIARAIVVLTSVFLLLRMLLLIEIENNLKKLRPFWISIGLLVYQVTIMAVTLFLPKLTRLDWELNFVLSLINIIFYGCITYALRLNEEYE